MLNHFLTNQTGTEWWLMVRSLLSTVKPDWTNPFTFIVSKCIFWSLQSRGTSEQPPFLKTCTYNATVVLYITKREPEKLTSQTILRVFNMSQVDILPELNALDFRTSCPTCWIFWKVTDVFLFYISYKELQYDSWGPDYTSGFMLQGYLGCLDSSHIVALLFSK